MEIKKWIEDACQLLYCLVTLMRNLLRFLGKRVDEARSDLHPKLGKKEQGRNVAFFYSFFRFCAPSESGQALPIYANNVIVLHSPK
jgi:hypothetical protein